MAVERKLMTFEDFEAFEALPENRERRFELINGEIVEKMPTEEHGAILVVIAAQFYNYLKQHRVGRAGVEVRHRLPEDEYNAFLPDISLNLDLDRPIVTRGAVSKMPDVAVEIKSPDDTIRQMREKAAYYLDHGARLVWLIYPEQRIVEVYTPGADLQMLTERDMLTGGELLPGFSLAISELFKDL